MDWDDLQPKRAKSVTIGEDLKTMGIAELEARVAALEAEIARVRTEIADKQRVSAAAAAVFKS